MPQTTIMNVFFYKQAYQQASIYCDDLADVCWPLAGRNLANHHMHVLFCTHVSCFLLHVSWFLHDVHAYKDRFYIVRCSGGSSTWSMRQVGHIEYTCMQAAAALCVMSSKHAAGMPMQACKHACMHALHRSPTVRATVQLYKCMLVSARLWPGIVILTHPILPSICSTDVVLLLLFAVVDASL